MKFSPLFLSATLFATALSPVGAFAQSRSHNEGKGAVIGAVLGALIGNKAGKGDTGATVIGAAIGGILGAAVGSELDEDEQNEIRRKHNDCLERNRRSSSYETRHTSGRFIILQDGYYREEPSRICRSYENTISIGGRTERTTGYACRDQYGNWSEVRETEIVYGVYNQPEQPYLTPGVMPPPPPPPPMPMRQCVLDPRSGMAMLSDSGRGVISYYGSAFDCQLALQNARGPLICVTQGGYAFALNLNTMSPYGYSHPNVSSCVRQLGGRMGGR